MGPLATPSRDRRRGRFDGILTPTATACPIVLALSGLGGCSGQNDSTNQESTSGSSTSETSTSESSTSQASSGTWSASSSSGSSTAHGSGSGSSSGAGPLSSLLLVAAGPASSDEQATLGFSYDVSSDTWSAGTTLGDATHGGIDPNSGSLAFTFTQSKTTALAVLTNATGATGAWGTSGAIQAATWASGTWTPFASIGSSSFTASSPPSLAVGSGGPELAFSADSSDAESTSTSTSPAGPWSAAAAIGSFTGGAPSLAARGADATAAYVRASDGALVAVDRTGGSWGTPQVIESGTASAAANQAFAPTLVALSGSGPALLVVYADSAGSNLHFATRAGSTWSSVQAFGLQTKVVDPDPARSGITGDSPSLSFATPVIALAGGKAMLAFTSASQHVFTSQFDGTRWSTATSVYTPWCLDCFDAAQVALAAGVGTATAEIVFGGDPTGNNDYVPYHMRLVAGQWTTPKPVVAALPGLFSGYALASSP